MGKTPRGKATGSRYSADLTGLTKKCPWRIIDKVANRMSEMMSDKLSDKMPECMSGRMSD